ncbi:cytochrome P450 [Pseudooceanicola sediminis]|uniref:Cytochrome P450 n=1 Tax=Pseudooceanicola sediminis TaxID=2211117 RepID=A0A399J3S6_9RHOB|nr:cytochrome P450 [Pseudooceanicola sediminis]KAA2316343.1 cytochrome P450 [Puniceibacterium sp. HSS470]RII39257.1 cytochrome P450 [Pseudooceanicola sediminis]|tara:strand:+ start:12379 stop:13581 length:1203 start_codon:yes stop_codon:yes gene_type:complete
MQQIDDRPILDVDPFGQQARDNPDALDRQIREAGPVVWVPKYGIWLTGQDSIVREVFSDWRRFSSAFGTGMTNVVREEPWRKPSVILEADPPVHTPNRKVLARVLSPAALRKLAVGFQQEADRMVDALVARGRFDLAADLAFAFPFKVLPDAAGLRPEGRPHLMPYSTLNFNAMGPRNDLYEAARKVVEDNGTFAYVAEQMREENILPGSFGAEIYAAAHNGEISHEDAGMLVRAFISAGIDTTVFGIGMTLMALIERPDQWDMLRADPDLARPAFEEGLRFQAPSPVIGRTTVAATQLGGVALGGDEKILMWLAAANRDPARWADPDTYDITRRPVGHLSFGTGIHGCVGQMVARLEAESVLRALASRVRRIHLVGTPERVQINWLRGYHSIPVEVEAA